MTGELVFEINMLSDEQAAQIWKTQSKRASNFQMFRDFVDMRDVGAKFSIPVPDGDMETANAIKWNFTEAAKERQRYLDATEGDEGAFQADDGTWHRKVAAPVLIQWKTDATDQQRTVTAPDGKTGTVTVKHVNRIHGRIVATDAIKKRGPRKRTTPDAATTPPNEANGTASAADASNVATPPDASVAASEAANVTNGTNGSTDAQNAQEPTQARRGGKSR